MHTALLPFVSLGSGQALLSFLDPRKVCPEARFQLPGQGSHLPAVGKQATFQDARGNHSQLPASTSLSCRQGELSRLGWRMGSGT